MRFSTEHRDELMTEAMQFYKYFLAIYFKNLLQLVLLKMNFWEYCDNYYFV